jgi:hypothetical protein
MKLLIIDVLKKILFYLHFSIFNYIYYSIDNDGSLWTGKANHENKRI